MTSSLEPWNIEIFHVSSFVSEYWCDVTPCHCISHSEVLITHSKITIATAVFVRYLDGKLCRQVLLFIDVNGLHNQICTAKWG